METLEELLKQKNEIEKKVNSLKNAKREEQELAFKKYVGKCFRNADNNFYVKIRGLDWDFNCGCFNVSCIAYDTEDSIFSAYEEYFTTNISNDNNWNEITQEEFENVVLGQINKIVKGDE